MNREDISRMAREAGLFVHKEVQPELKCFAALVIADFLQRTGQYVTNDASREAAIANAVAAEREACAKVCEEGVDTEHPTVTGHIMKAFGKSSLLAAAIRARGQV